MYTRDDLIDVIMEYITPIESGQRRNSFVNGQSPKTQRDKPEWQETPLRGRIFLSEYEIKKALTPGAQHLTIPEGAIVSPLAQEWLALRGISIVRQ